MSLGNNASLKDVIDVFDGACDNLQLGINGISNSIKTKKLIDISDKETLSSLNTKVAAIPYSIEDKIITIPGETRVVTILDDGTTYFSHDLDFRDSRNWLKSGTMKWGHVYDPSLKTQSYYSIAGTSVKKYSETLAVIRSSTLDFNNSIPNGIASWWDGDKVKVLCASGSDAGAYQLDSSTLAIIKTVTTSVQYINGVAGQYDHTNKRCVLHGCRDTNSIRAFYELDANTFAITRTYTMSSPNLQGLGVYYNNSIKYLYSTSYTRTDKFTSNFALLTSTSNPDSNARRGAFVIQVPSNQTYIERYLVYKNKKYLLEEIR